MTIQYISIAAAPLEEDCAQVGQPGYEGRSSRECLIFKRMLQRLYPPPNDNAALVVKGAAHDFGSYREVRARFDDQDETAREYAYRLERETPARWDAIALYELLWQERKARFSLAVARGEIAEMPAQYRPAAFPALPADKTLPELCRLFPL
ncbi:MAG: hypothetical protein LBF93_04935 [Zoogloeaceae bacterium]|jgi:hypothetical protein|nr:hypothetical protein [Zoogloeaceae bacterium]